MKRTLILILLAAVLALGAWVGVDAYLSSRPLRLDAAEIAQLDFRVDPRRDENWMLRDAGEIARIVGALNDLALRPRDRAGRRDTGNPRYVLALGNLDLQLRVTADSVEVSFSGSSRYNGTYFTDTAELLAALAAAGE